MRVSCLELHLEFVHEAMLAWVRYTCLSLYGFKLCLRSDKVQTERPVSQSFSIFLGANTCHFHIQSFRLRWRFFIFNCTKIFSTANLLGNWFLRIDFKREEPYRSWKCEEQINFEFSKWSDGKIKDSDWGVYLKSTFWCYLFVVCRMHFEIQIQIMTSFFRGLSYAFRNLNLAV